MFCSQCGAVNKDGAKFCSSCGKAINKAIDTQTKKDESTNETETKDTKVKEVFSISKSQNYNRLFLIGSIVILASFLIEYIMGRYSSVGFTFIGFIAAFLLSINWKLKPRPNLAYYLLVPIFAFFITFIVRLPLNILIEDSEDVVKFSVRPSTNANHRTLIGRWLCKTRNQNGNYSQEVFTFKNNNELIFKAKDYNMTGIYNHKLSTVNMTITYISGIGSTNQSIIGNITKHDRGSLNMEIITSSGNKHYSECELDNTKTSIKPVTKLQGVKKEKKSNPKSNKLFNIADLSFFSSAVGVMVQCKWISDKEAKRAGRIMKYIISRGNIPGEKADFAVKYGFLGSLNDLKSSGGCLGQIASKYKRNYYEYISDPTLSHIN